MHSLVSKEVEFKAREQVYSVQFSADRQMLFLSSPNDKNVEVWELSRSPKQIRSLPQPSGALLNGLRVSSDGRLLASAHVPSEVDEVMSFWTIANGTSAGELVESHTGITALSHASMDFVPHSSTLIRSQAGGNFKRGPSTEIYDGLLAYEARGLTRLWGLNTEPIRPVALGVSHNGKWAAVVGWDRVVIPENPGAYFRSNLILVNLESRTIQSTQVVLGRNCNVTAVTWSSDDARVAVGGDPMGSYERGPPAIEVVDVQSGRRVGGLPAKSHLVGMKYTPNGKYFVIALSRLGVQLWNADNSELLETIPGDPTAIALSNDGTRLAIAENTNVSVWTLK